jgi:hypothetical protein
LLLLGELQCPPPPSLVPPSPAADWWYAVPWPHARAVLANHDVLCSPSVSTGAGESGKSTFVKQMKIIHGDGCVHLTSLHLLADTSRHMHAFSARVRVRGVLPPSLLTCDPCLCPSLYLLCTRCWIRTMRGVHVLATRPCVAVTPGAAKKKAFRSEASDAQGLKSDSPFHSHARWGACIEHPGTLLKSLQATGRQWLTTWCSPWRLSWRACSK